MKSLVYLINKIFSLEHYIPIQFFIELQEDQDLIFDVVGNMSKVIDDKCSENRQGMWRYVPFFRDAISLQSEKLLKELYFRKVNLDRAIFEKSNLTLESPKHLDLFCNEIYLS
jgi:hypothetical protein